MVVTKTGGLDALLEGAAVAGLCETGWICVLGEDRARWLNGMTTNAVGGLQAGEGSYNFFLSAQGRIQGDGYVFAGAEELWIETGREQVAGLMALLERFIIMDDVELSDASAERHGVLCAGPQAEAVLRAAGVQIGVSEAVTLSAAEWRGRAVEVVCAYGPLVPRFEVWTADAAAAEALMAALAEAGAAAVEAGEMEQLRVLEGTPRYGVDIRDRELPQETAQVRALHFAKGCYLGQEIVERIRSRGNVHRAFGGFFLVGDAVEAGAKLIADGKEVGELTSVATVTIAGRAVQVGLGYLRRERTGTIEYPGGQATPVTLPFQVADEAVKLSHL